MSPISPSNEPTLPNVIDLNNNHIANLNSEVRLENFVKILNDIKLFFHQQSNLNSLIACNIGYISDEI